MNKYFLLTAIIVVIISCKAKQADKKIIQTDSTSVVITPDTGNIIEDTHYYWSAEWDNKNGMLMKKTTPITADSLTATNIIQKLNILYPKIRLRYIRTSNDSMFVNINNSTYLTQQIGSSGAESYLAEVTYNLTELNGINYINIKFKEGDHASPGTYTRTDFIHEKY